MADWKDRKHKVETFKGLDSSVERFYPCKEPAKKGKSMVDLMLRLGSAVTPVPFPATSNTDEPTMLAGNDIDRAHPTNRDNEIQVLREQVVALRCSLAAVEKRLAELELCGNASPVPGTSKAPLKGVKTPERTPHQIFPNEIFLQIAGHLQPGSRTLLCLASASKNLFALLAPRLLMKLDSNIILDTRFDYYRRNKLDLLSKHVRELDLFPVELAGGHEESRTLANGTRRVLKACAENLIVLTIRLAWQENVWNLWENTFPNVRTLDIRGLARGKDREHHRGHSERNLVRDFPNVRKLFLHDEYYEFRHFLQLQSLEQLSLDLDEELLNFPDLVAKIRSCRVTSDDIWAPFAIMPQFQPTSLDFHLVQWTYDPDAWRQVVELTSLRKLVGWSYTNTSQLFEIGFPPNIEDLELEIACSVSNAADLEALRTKLPKKLKRCVIQVGEFEKNPERATWFCRELCLWAGLCESSGGELTVYDHPFHLESVTIDNVEKWYEEGLREIEVERAHS